ncbi:hypothetical protein ATANTOWER_013926 [Ataeniobius toweri]|uniref:Uncharacterized protein n=1 Tax=Ataeniobius toweri TaxID=208326 RepID=A0ABU7AVM3_9TELE|nr:hypothetical protein [Ataeniobius toweri]
MQMGQCEKASPIKAVLSGSACRSLWVWLGFHLTPSGRFSIFKTSQISSRKNHSLLIKINTGIIPVQSGTIPPGFYFVFPPTYSLHIIYPKPYIALKFTIVKNMNSF